MSAGANQLDLIEASKATERRGSSDLEKKQSENGLHTKENKIHSHYDSTNESQPEVLVGPNGEQYPTQEEARTLRRVCGKIPWVAWTIAFVELCERFSYYGTTAVFVNFIQQDLPAGSDTGAVGTFGQPGALGMGQRASTGLTLFNSFWAVSLSRQSAWPGLSSTVPYADPGCIHRRHLSWPLQNHSVVHSCRSHRAPVHSDCEYPTSDCASERGYRYLRYWSRDIWCRNGRFQIQYFTLDRRTV